MEDVRAASLQPGETSPVNTTQGERVGRKGMEKWFSKTFSLLCLDWKPLSPWPSRQPSDCLEIVPSSFLHRGKAGTVCYGRCPRSQQLTGRKVLFLKKKKCPNPPLISGARRLNLIPSSYWVALDKSHCWLCSALLEKEGWSEAGGCHSLIEGMLHTRSHWQNPWWIKWALYLCFIPLILCQNQHI